MHCTSIEDCDSMLTIQILSIFLHIVIYLNSGIVNSSEDSMFYYKGDKGWSDFYDYGFVPVFSPTFNDSELERQAKEMCGDVSACLFDVAATGRLDIGMSALSAEEEQKIVQELAVPSESI